MSAKKYVACVAGFMFVFMAANLALWHFVVKDIFMQDELNRMGSFSSTRSFTPKHEYSKRHVELKEYLASGRKESFDVVTLGDSFSNGSGAGYYQDYISEKYGLKLVNARFRNHCLEDLYILTESGMLDELNPSAVILESVGRHVQDRLGASEISPSKFSMTREYAERFLHDRVREKSEQLASGFFAPVMTEAVKKFLVNIVYRMTDSERLGEEAYIAGLSRELFTNPVYENTLLYYYYDLNYLNESPNAEMINRNLNAAAKILADKNIKLIFMPCVDKYDLYYPYITNKRGRPENTLFDELSNMPGKNYVLIDTKAILRKELERGGKDVYWFGNTHWSWKGSEKVCDELAKYLLPEKLN